MSKKIVIIGAGLAGLSSAALLAKRGFDVTVLEKNPGPGGVAGTYRENGFTFDTGPTWYLMPEVFETFFAEFGKSPSQYYKLVDLDPSYRIFLGSGERVDITRDVLQNQKVFEGFEKGSSEKLVNYLADAKYKYDVAMKEFLYRDYTSILDFFNRRMMVDGLRLHVLRTLDAYARRYFKSDVLRKIIEYNIVFLGCAPHKSPALYSLMSHVDMTQGVRYPIGGICRLPEAIHSLALEQGARFRFNCGVKKIIIEKGKARRVETSEGFIEADIVLSAAEYHHTETDLLDKKWRSYSPRYWEKRTLAPGAFIICLGLGKKVKGITHHNLFLTPEWDQHFAAIFDSPAWPDNPSYYVGCPSATDPGAAPAGCESLFFLVPVAPGLDDNEAKRRSYAYSVLRHFEQLTGERFLDSVRVMKIVSHSDFINNGSYFKGTALGLAHTLWQTASFRPGHKSKKVKNLYFSGHYTHPGIGMPMVIISSHVTSQRIEREMGVE